MSKSHNKPTSTKKSQNSGQYKSGSSFDTFSKSFLESFSEKDKKNTQIYSDMKAIDATKEYKS